MRLVLALVAGLAIAAPASGATWTFGRRGGNIRPAVVRIDSSGQVTAVGTTVTKTHLTRATLKRLLRTARTAGFFGMPAFVVCPRVLPDVASLYITYRSARQTHTVSVHGGCSPRFATLYDTLTRATAGA